MVENIKSGEEDVFVELEFCPDDETALDLLMLKDYLSTIEIIVQDLYSKIITIALNRSLADEDVVEIYENVEAMKRRIEEIEKLNKKFAKKLGMPID